MRCVDGEQLEGFVYFLRVLFVYFVGDERRGCA